VFFLYNQQVNLDAKKYGIGLFVCGFHFKQDQSNVERHEHVLTLTYNSNPKWMLGRHVEIINTLI